MAPTTVSDTQVNTIRFTSRVQYGAELPMASEARVKHEPMLFSASVGYARDHGGALTRAFLHALSPEWLEGHVVIDSRTHMLMPGWYPCIPGWHLDDVPRTRPDGQPDHQNPLYRAEHVMALWGSASITSFLPGDIDLSEPQSGDPTYAVWHAILEDRIRRGELTEHQALTQRLIFFDWQTFHKGNPATKVGWRFFIRASRNTKRQILNERRAQVQVYLPAVNAGW